MTLVCPGPIQEAIQAHAEANVSREVVGVLAGSYDTSTSNVSRAYRASNAADRTTMRYEIDPAEELKLLERIDDAGLDCVGFYHSHPHGPSEPSETDAQLAAWPGYSYGIVSVASGTASLESWRWLGDRFEPEPVRIV